MINHSRAVCSLPLQPLTSARPPQRACPAATRLGLELQPHPRCPRCQAQVGTGRQGGRCAFNQSRGLPHQPAALLARADAACHSQSRRHCLQHGPTATHWLPDPCRHHFKGKARRSALVATLSQHCSPARLGSEQQILPDRSDGPVCPDSRASGAHHLQGLAPFSQLSHHCTVILVMSAYKFPYLPSGIAPVAPLLMTQWAATGCMPPI